MYPAAAQAANVTGAVSAMVTVDEDGNVISANKEREIQTDSF